MKPQVQNLRSVIKFLVANNEVIIYIVQDVSIYISGLQQRLMRHVSNNQERFHPHF